jgi:predicted aspartyl protease
VISGIVTDGRATVAVTFRLLNQPDFAIEFVIDTGFTDYLCLPPAFCKIGMLPVFS